MLENKTNDTPKSYLKVPYPLLGLFTFMIMQTFAAGWWASAMATKMDVLQDNLAKLELSVQQRTNDRYTSSEATKDFYVRDAKILRIEADIEKMKENIYSRTHK